MQVLLAVDGSPPSEAAIADTARGSWPDGTAIEILSVIPARARLTADPAADKSDAACADRVNSTLSGRAPGARADRGIASSLMCFEAGELGANHQSWLK